MHSSSLRRTLPSRSFLHIHHLIPELHRGAWTSMGASLALHAVRSECRIGGQAPTCLAAATVRSVHFLLGWGAARNRQLRWVLLSMAGEVVD